MHHLVTKLKTLRLGGLLDTLEHRIRIAEEQQLGYADFFELIVNDEIERREAKKLKNRLTKACFEEEKTIESFDFGANPAVPAKRIKDLATGQYLVKGENVFICGLPGVGKTHIAQGLGHHACRQGRSVLFVKATQMFRALAAARADHTWEERIHDYVRVDVLILDDFGLRQLTAAQADDIAEIVSERQMKGGMIFTSNRRVEDWLGLFPDPVFGNAVLDRFAHNAHQIVVDGESYRRHRRPAA